jgi:hypothetical protein
LGKEYYTIIDKPKILFPWMIGDIATSAPGNIDFSIRFYMTSEDGSEVIYNLNTRTATSKVLETLSIEITDETFPEQSEHLKEYGPEEQDIKQYWESIHHNPTTL